MKTFLRTESTRLIASLLVSLVATLPGVAAVLRVPNSYATIQGAVDAASSGDTIRIGAGVYVEQILISRKNLTLEGSPGAVIRATPGLTATVANVCSVYLLGIERSDVVVKGLTFEGEHLDNEYDCSLGGILFNGASGRVEDCTVRGFRGATNVYAFGGNGVAGINNLATPLVNFQVLRCTFADNGLSIHVRGADGKTNHLMEFVIADNLINGIGPTGLGSENGILISEGASGAVLRNIITDHYSTVEASMSSGIFAVDWRFQYGFVESGPISLLPVRYEGNTFRNNQLNLASVLGHGSQIMDNTFQGSSDTPGSTGLGVSGTGVQIVGSKFADLARGVWLVGNDPSFGTRYGVATNASLVDNRFCDVTKPIDIEPLVVNVSQQGTLTCPFPSPPLAITPAILLSWPEKDEGWSVESAANADGPWAPSDATLWIQSGRHGIATPADSDHRFFRLRSP